MWIRIARECYRLSVQPDLIDPAAGTLDAIGDLDAMPQQGQLDTQAIERPRYHRIHTQNRGFTAQAQEAPDDQPERDTGAAGIHSPSTVEGNRSLRDSLVLCASLIAVRER